MGVCHRDMSLENILVDEYTRSVVIDLGMCLRVPYDDGGEVKDVSCGGLRRLIKPLIPCGKPNYISPEVLTSDQAYLPLHKVTQIRFRGHPLYTDFMNTE